MILRAGIAFLAFCLACSLASGRLAAQESKTPPETNPKAPGKAKVQPPAPPEGARPLPPVLEPARSPVERRDLIQEFRKRHPIEGFYRLKAMVKTGAVSVPGGRGYLVIGHRHLSLHLYAPSGSSQANIQAVFRSYRIVGDRIVASTLLGHRNKPNGDIALERIGHASQHRFVLTGSVLRIHQTLEEYLEFERIE